MPINPSNKRAAGGSRHAFNMPDSHGALDRWLRPVAVLGDERGSILIVMALLVVTLLGVIGMAVDLGWAYWNRQEVQHGADAAALAGVIYEPSERAKAHTEAIAAALANGYNNVDGTTITVVDFDDDPTAVENNSQLRVTVTHDVDTFFLRIFGIDSFTIARTAVASTLRPCRWGARTRISATTPQVVSGPTSGGTSTATTRRRPTGIGTHRSASAGTCSRDAA